MLKLVLPKGSLEKATFQLFEEADLTVRRSSDVDYRATIDDPRIAEVRILRPQEIPVYVANGLFDVGIAGRDWIRLIVQIPLVPLLAALARILTLGGGLAIRRVDRPLPALLVALPCALADTTSV